MTALLIAAASSAVVLGRLVRLVLTDGLGHRPPPSSHRRWDEDALIG